MIVQSTEAIDPVNAISQEDALEHLARMESPRVPTFYEDGIIDAGKGYYQLARHDDGRRVLIFALNLEDLQLKEYPGYGYLFAHPGALFGVNIYDKTASATEIYNDLVNHQAGLTRVMREEYTLFRTEKNKYQSRAISYRLTHTRRPNILPAKFDISIDAFIHSLHDKHYTPVISDPRSLSFDKLRTSHVPLEIKDLAPNDAVFYILNHYTDQLNKLAQGREEFQNKDYKLSRASRAWFNFKSHGAVFLDKLGHVFKKTWKEMKKKHPNVYFEIVGRIIAFGKLFTLIHEVNLEFFSAVFEVFSPPHVESTGHEIPEGLRDLILPPTAATPLNPYLLRLDAAPTERMAPLNLNQADIYLHNIPVLPGSPFEISEDRIPDIGALRAPLGTVIHMYNETTLMMQANGVWMAQHHVSGRTYVGYNRKLDTNNKPIPSPILQAWLGDDQIICYTPEGHDHKVTKMEWKKAAGDLKHIINCGDTHLIAAHMPEHDHGPHIIPAREKPNMRYLDFSGALNQYAKSTAAADYNMAKAPSHPPIAHPHRRKWPKDSVHVLRPGNAV